MGGAGPGPDADRVDRRLSGGVHREDRDDHRGADRSGPEQDQREPLAMDAIVFPPVLLGPLMPTLVVLTAAAIVLVLDIVPRSLPRELPAMVALAGMVGALLATLTRWSAPGRAFRDMVVLDNFALFFNVVICCAAGTTNLDRIAAAIASRPRDPLFVAGLGLLMVGFGFKISSVPFHMWVPDVYQGAPTSVTALIATGSKAGAFAALIRVLTVTLRGVPPDWAALLWAMAAVTMTVGNVVALAQSNLKRMLAYSSIAHVGYMLVGLVAGGVGGAGAVLCYLLTYTFTTAGAFGVITLCEPARGEAVEVSDYAGLARRHPVLAAALGLFLLSLVGIPPLAGFVGKFYVFGAAVRAGYFWLAVIGVLNSAAAAYYYLRIIVYMYMREPEGAATTYASSFAGGLALAIALLAIVLLGVMPAPFVDLAQAAVAPLLR